MSRDPKTALGAALTLLSGAAIYAALRTGQRIFAREPNPATALYDTHSGYFWRILIALYAAGMLAPLLFWLARRHFTGAARALPALVAITSAVVVVQALLVP
jgi:hypothetical protein